MNRRVKIIDSRGKLFKKYGKNPNSFPKFKWQKSFYDHVIRDQDDFWRHFQYTIYNHKKHGLPEDWKYTSLRKDIFHDLIDNPQ